MWECVYEGRSAPRVKKKQDIKLHNLAKYWQIFRILALLQCYTH